MKQVNVTIGFDEEKLTALKRYMGKKNLEPETELTEALKKLYEKYVPGPVREYIDENDVDTPSAARPRRTPRTTTKPQMTVPGGTTSEVEHNEQP